jgi:hypothetical protein
MLFLLVVVLSLASTACWYDILLLVAEAHAQPAGTAAAELLPQQTYLAGGRLREVLQVWLKVVVISHIILVITAAIIAAMAAAAESQLLCGCCQVCCCCLILPLLQLLTQPLYAVKETHLSCTCRQYTRQYNIAVQGAVQPSVQL